MARTRRRNATLFSRGSTKPVAAAAEVSALTVLVAATVTVAAAVIVTAGLIFLCSKSSPRGHLLVIESSIDNCVSVQNCKIFIQVASFKFLC